MPGCLKLSDRVVFQQMLPVRTGGRKRKNKNDSKLWHIGGTRTRTIAAFYDRTAVVPVGIRARTKYMTNLPAHTLL